MTHEHTTKAFNASMPLKVKDKTLHDAYMEGYNGEPSKYLWSSSMAECHFLGQCCKKAGFVPAETITQSRGSSYRLNDYKVPVKIEYEGTAMACEIETWCGRGNYQYI